AGPHPVPGPLPDTVTTTTHKTRGGPRGGIIISKPEYSKKINSAMFPGQQGGPLEHVIAGKAVALKIAAGDDFADRQRRVLEGSRTLAARLSQADCADNGVRVLTGGRDRKSVV